MRAKLVVIALAALTWTPPASAQDWKTEPTKFWEIAHGGRVDRLPNGCTAHVGNSEVTIDTTDGIETLSADAALTLMTDGRLFLVLGGDLLDLSAGTRDVNLAFATRQGDQATALAVFQVPLALDRDLKVAFDVPTDARSALANSQGFVIQELSGDSVPIWYEDSAEPSANLQPTLALLERCANELERTDSGSGEPAVVQPKLETPIAEMIGRHDYPATALRAGWERRSVVMLTISAKGLVSDCDSQDWKTRADVVLDTHTCNLLSKRARFIPAIDAKGLPTQGSANLAISWKIPTD